MSYNLQRLLVIIGIVFIPFYELFFRVFPFVRVIAPDTRVPKELIAVMFALSIGLLAVFQGTLKPFKNKYLLIIPIFLLLSMFMAPQTDLFINNVNVGDMYFWRPFAKVLCFMLLVVAIASMEIDFKPVINAMVICGAVMSGYVVLQYLGFDQFWMQKEGIEFWQVTGRRSGGNLGQPTIVASFIAMLLPLALYLKKYKTAGLMLLALLATWSEMALLSLPLMTAVYVMSKEKRAFYPILASIVVVVVCVFLLLVNHSGFRQFAMEHSNGRIQTWTQVVGDIQNGAIIGSSSDFSFTGVGFGRFPFIFPDKHSSIFLQAHSDPLEFTYNCGLAGLILLLTGVYVMLRSAWNKSNLSLALSISFITIFFISLGNFPFQLGAHQFYSAVIVGLLHNNLIIGDQNV